jgi:hypothetical protein
MRMEVDHSVLRLSWLELEAANAWEAVQRAAEVVAEILPELLRTRTLRIDATLQGSDPDLRRPVGA